MAEAQAGRELEAIQVVKAMLGLAQAQVIFDQTFIEAI